MSNHHLYTNRLINEKSPYLQQHAHNPVDWYAWGEEAFSTARLEDKPIFLSIGYSTCHWCHVMEVESFQNVEIAKRMNDTFINIKIDREERPDIDGLYMEFAQGLLSGAAGWPLNILLTPDLEPFFATTYLPPHPKHQLMGLSDLIWQIKEVWNSQDRKDLLEQAEKIVDFFASNLVVFGEEIPEKDWIQGCVEVMLKMADSTYGGMRGSPKFPIGYQWNFLMRYATLAQDSRSLFFVQRTLDMMQQGGIYDHLGGGFSRYSVDALWFAPHFEKMLYDNALLAFAYLEAWQITEKPLYRKVCEEILSYVLRDMTHVEGGFYSAEDADSEGHEGYFYTWTYDEIKEILGEDASKLFCEFYGITQRGNFEGRNILHTPLSIEAFAAQKKEGVEALQKMFSKQKQLLWQVREQRMRPQKDNKILSSWNGLMIFAMVHAGISFTDKSFTEAALKAAQFIKKHLWIEGKLLRRWCEGEGKCEAGLDEYACLIKGLLGLFETNQGTEWLAWAIELTKIVHEQFKADKGAFYQTDGRDPHLILRRCHFQDGSEPSGNAVHCENLLKLYQLTYERKYIDQAEDIFKAVNSCLASHPLGYTYHMLNLMRYYDAKASTLVIALNPHEEFSDQLLLELSQTFHQHMMVIWKKFNDTQLSHLIPFVNQQRCIGGHTTLYICQQGRCLEPITDVAQMLAAINLL